MSSTGGASVPVTAASTEPDVDAASSSRLLAIAWITTLLISRLPEIVLRDIFGLSVPWMPWAVVALSAGLWVASRSIDDLRPLERYLAVMTALAVLLAVIPLIFGSTVWTSLVPPTGHRGNPAAATSCGGACSDRSCCSSWRLSRPGQPLRWCVERSMWPPLCPSSVWRLSLLSATRSGRKWPIARRLCRSCSARSARAQAF